MWPDLDIPCLILPCENCDHFSPASEMLFPFFLTFFLWLQGSNTPPKWKLSQRSYSTFHIIIPHQHHLTVCELKRALRRWKLPWSPSSIGGTTLLWLWVEGLKILQINKCIPALALKELVSLIEIGSSHSKNCSFSSKPLSMSDALSHPSTHSGKVWFGEDIWKAFGPVSSSKWEQPWTKSRLLMSFLRRVLNNSKGEDLTNSLSDCPRYLAFCVLN